MALADDVQTQAGALLAKISDAEPAGQNASYDDRFEAVRAAIASLDSPTGGEVDWKSIAKSTREILSSASKDLLVASYFSYAMLQTQGLMGLAVGLVTIEGLFNDYWDTMFPPARRLRGRGNALGWLVDKLEQALPGLPLQPSDRPTVDLIDERWTSLGGKAREKLGDHVPPMRGITDALTRIKLKLPDAPKAEPEAPAAPPAAAPASTPAAAPASTPAAAPAPASAPASPEPAASEPEPEEVDPMDALLEEAKAWVEPIPGGDPAGADARYEPEYEACRSEIAQLEAPTGGEPDWKAIEKQAGELLKAKSKDVLMASYFAYARYKQRGLAQLPLGLVVLEQIIETHHEGMFPKRPRGRGNATSWFLTQLEAALSQEQLKPTDRPTVLALDKAYKALASTLRSRLEDNAPSTTPMSQRLQRMLLAVPEQKKAPPPPPPPKPTATPTPTPTPTAAPTPKPASTPATPMPTAAADVGSADEVNKFLLDTGRSLTKAAAVLRRAELSTPAAYRLTRAGLWMHLHKAPPADAGGKTQIPPLPAARRKQFETILANSKWPAAIEETESALMQFRFCLDLNRMTDQALENLGPTHAAARSALAGEVASLLRRLPELVDYTAGDGTPLADDETKAWLATLNPSDDEGGGGGSPDAADKAAMSEVRGGMAAKPMDAMKLARERISEAPTPRSRFVRQLVLAEICLGSNQAKLARGMFSALEQEIAKRNLLQWEPDLAGRCLEGLVRAIRGANKAGGKFTGADEAFERLCLVDPAAAARLAG